MAKSIEVKSITDMCYILFFWVEKISDSKIHFSYQLKQYGDGYLFFLIFASLMKTYAVEFFCQLSAENHTSLYTHVPPVIKKADVLINVASQFCIKI